MVTHISIDTLLEPPTASVRPYPHHCQDLALQKYLLLHEQHESLRQHLDELRPSARQTSLCTPVSPSPATSPTTRMRMSFSPGAPRRRQPPPQHTFSLPARNGASSSSSSSSYHDHEETSAAEVVAVEEAKLCDVNEGIKRALTELLNCETVRGDRAFRTWVQCRLMDTERELRSGRRRRSAPGLGP
ncbi:hypothetical protein C8A01DRAFT_16181 [Parachaetomium inaequale]|uniref:Uncharacterized protein n=1 Tax=Parachaetomium inaequale TaxID=2588326 RepID=A0AAN6SS02_9PEZI|nr:hypothetical protein C8A01DRAFT_16181 [Parachaetomium inaequale]